MANHTRIPIPTLTRFANLYRVLLEEQKRGVRHINSADLESRTAIPAAQIRKDLNVLGEMGKPGVGYEVGLLTKRLGEILRVDHGHPFALVGAGHLGLAIANYPGFAEYGFHLRAIFDNDPAKIGQDLNGIVIEDSGKMPTRLLELSLRIAVLTVPPLAAQEATDLMIRGGVRWILNFTPTHLHVPDNCVVRDVHLTSEFAILGHYADD